MSDPKYERENFSLAISSTRYEETQAFQPIAVNIAPERGNPNIIEVNTSVSRLEFKGKLLKIEIEEDVWYRMILSDRGIIAAYYVGFDYFEIGEKGLDLSKNYPEMFEYYLRHEIAHKRYFSLEQKDQVELNKSILGDPILFKLLAEFAYELYNIPTIQEGKTGGEIYLDIHSLSNEFTKQIKFAIALTAPTLKDPTILKFNLHGAEQEVFAGFLISEFISHMAIVLTDEDLQLKLISLDPNENKERIMEIVKKAYDYLSDKPELLEKFQSYNLFAYSVKPIVEAINELI